MTVCAPICDRSSAKESGKTNELAANGSHRKNGMTNHAKVRDGKLAQLSTVVSWAALIQNSRHIAWLDGNDKENNVIRLCDVDLM